MSKSITFLLGDDHNIVRQGLQFVIEDVVENTEINHASSLDQILSQLKSNSFDIAILDAQFPDGNSLSIIAEIKRLQPEIKILIFTSFEEDNYSLKFINEGADGFLNKLSEEAEIQNAIQEMIEKGSSFPPFTTKMLQLSDEHIALLNPLNQLTERELEIAVLYAKGFGNLEIANSLSLRQNTISTFKKRIFDKLKVETLVDLIDLVRTHHDL
ncbi:response regulator transcription factor [Kaistella flava (ex Peng et al. 2021)]|uniref:Response regulator transcription factor n=1 Tax=Kaistella flava (ex Peng et al. 2021) TaxID=2038776 RepID=A0A7M2Y7J0_9FLAO|nr:response regulator transcription factor [Kaistella flava (ex Peng et al. 2021)]QOW09634.1 response regulator transcription factor [Kaistella flava (ex Peng et al. 2021)]